MSESVNILIVEDSQDDAELVLRELRRTGFDPKWKRVETEPDFLEELKKSPDIILSDYAMPRFTGLRAAALLKESGLEIPFILISGTVGEDVAVEAMKRGATDYLLKDRIARLGMAVEQALQQKQSRVERKRAEGLMRQSEERYRSLFDSAHDAIFTIAADGTFTSLNRAVETIAKISRAEWIGKPFAPMVHPDDLPLAVEMFNRVLNGGQAPVHELRGHPSLNHPALMEMTLAPQKDESGKIIGVLGIGRDITGRKQAEKALQEAALFAQSTIDGLSTHLCVLDGNGTILATNKAWRKFAETNPPAPHRADKGDNYLQVCDEVTGNEAADAAAFAEGIRAVIRGARAEFAMEYACHSPTEQRWFLGRVTRFAGDGSVRVVVAHENVSERKKLEEQFRQAQKLEGIGQLAGGVAHDFNNILAVIQMQADLLKSDDTLSKAQLELTSEIAAAAQRAAALTRQLLLFSRKETMRPEDLDLDQSINDMTKMLRRTLGADIQLQFKFSMQPLFIHADAGMVDQILLNLTVNARDAMPNGGLLVIETSAAEFDEEAAARSAQARPGQFVCLSVSDTGCGIPRENLSKIFEPFFTTKEVGKGTGLGLATVFGIVQQHKGWINVYSEVGRGTTFRIYLPRLTKLAGEKPEPSSMMFMRGGDETILFVEDDAFLRPSISQTLSRLGYRVLAAGNGKEALEVWGKNRDEIRLLLTDMVMPGGMTGKELSRRLLQENPKLKVIFASGYSAEVVGKEFPLEDGVNFLNKPFDTRKLAQTVRDILDKPSKGHDVEN
jgi:PAS domain S-box-containing protein